MTPHEHKMAWLERYGDDYATAADRESAYQDHQRNLAIMRKVFALDATDNSSAVSA